MFGKQFVLLIIVLLLILWPAAMFAEQPAEFRAVKITNVDSDVMFSDQRIAEAMDYLASIGINVILPVVWNGSGANGVYTLYPSSVIDSLFGQPLHPAFAVGHDPLQRIIIEAHRNGMNWRPVPLIIDENDRGASTRGRWEVSDIAGYKPGILIKKEQNYGTVYYCFTVPQTTWYNVYAYIVTGPLATDRARYVIYSDNDSTAVLVNQQDYYNRGWQALRLAYLTAGQKTVLKLDNINVPAGQYVVADAAMVMINRKLSPDVIISRLQTPNTNNKKAPRSFQRLQNHPNPFNAPRELPISLRKDHKSIYRFMIYWEGSYKHWFINYMNRIFIASISMLQRLRA
ncbi:family 10 glycosylhydrolase [candidate division KSB1 bacterium]|nr:family 10 glycosylhydrolase [candidate division KSB1 bacterium]